jgi:hypothetical protein
MSETQVLLSRIAALRQQLEQAKGLTRHPEASAAARACGGRPMASGVPDSPADSNHQGNLAPRSPLGALEQVVADGSTQTVLLDRTLHQLNPEPARQDPASMPKQLTTRARRILEEGRELLCELRRLADVFETPDSERGCGTAPSLMALWLPPLPADPNRHDPLTRRYRETAAMANTALRMLTAFPDAASAQLALCDGLEAILGVVAERIAEMNAVLQQRRRESDQVETLGRLLTALYAKEPVGLDSFVPLGEAILAEAQQAGPLRFLSARLEPDGVAEFTRIQGPGSRLDLNSGEFSYATPPARFVASHSLTVAQVIARIVRQDADYRSEPLRPVLAALLHDAGMLGVPPAILAQAGPFDDAQRRIVEAHTRLGAELMERFRPDGSWLADAAVGHHERLDGTGYPAGRQEAQLDPLTRLIAVCTGYADRPDRHAPLGRTGSARSLLCRAAASILVLPRWLGGGAGRWRVGPRGRHPHGTP